LKPLSGKELARLLEQRGWALLRVSGSHHIYGHQGNPIRLSIPVHGNRPLKSGLQRYLMKAAGLGDDETRRG
jgi:predicted RNA binding protein YcfA (HicA-like mRNA interferase family)